MKTEEIPRERWVSFLDAFSREHAGWVVTIEILGSDIGDQEETTALPLVGITADMKDRERRIEIIAGRGTDEHLTRIIETPRRLWVREAAEETRTAVEVESDDLTVTLVRFR